ncbi:hypothetical protein AGLY_000928 [Aphis glycines]|uniref:Uncharacterized protein n=1 Tax=Aphis glycines TaxID=307491 RepID=A0A6G0U8C6_APHGL|nr:hypothetical protein AGLY_000928 [Aphis glycines]
MYRWDGYNLCNKIDCDRTKQFVQLVPIVEQSVPIVIPMCYKFLFYSSVPTTQYRHMFEGIKMNQCTSLLDAVLYSAATSSTSSSTTDTSVSRTRNGHTHIFFCNSTCFSFRSKYSMIFSRWCWTRRPFSMLNSSSALASISSAFSLASCSMKAIIVKKNKLGNGRRTTSREMEQPTPNGKLSAKAVRRVGGMGIVEGGVGRQAVEEDISALSTRYRRDVRVDRNFL